MGGAVCNAIRDLAQRRIYYTCVYYLPKFTIFGKYVRLSVCYLPKFTIFGKYVRLSVCYLPKFTIFGKYVRLSVCLSVCLSVSLSVLSSITHERFDISSPNLVHIWNG